MMPRRSEQDIFFCKQYNNQHLLASATPRDYVSDVTAHVTWSHINKRQYIHSLFSEIPRSYHTNPNSSVKQTGAASYYSCVQENVSK